jgi:hypothetical protein
VGEIGRPTTAQKTINKVMIQFIVEFLIQILLELPGAVVVWIFFKGKKKYTKITEDYYTQNLIISIILYAVIILKHI